MSLTTIAHLAEHVGRKVTLAGWLYNSRSSGNIIFLIIRDGTGMCQCVAEKASIGEERFAELTHLGQESSLELSGVVRADERSIGGRELAVTGVRIIQAATDYPIAPKSHGVDFLLKHRHLHLRSTRQWAMGKVRHTLVDAIRRFFKDNGFVLVDTPILTPVAGEEAQSLFKVDYFGDELHLAQTGQLYLEAAAASYGKAYCFGPTFRAEKSKTRRHLTEFWMVEPELAFVDLDGLLELAEQFVCAIVAEVRDKNRHELEMLNVDMAALDRIRPPFQRMTYTRAVELLRGKTVSDFLDSDLRRLKERHQAALLRLAELEKQRTRPVKKRLKDKEAAEMIELRTELSELDAAIDNNPRHASHARRFEWGKDLGGSDETIISRMHDRPVFVTHYPKTAKAFYMKTEGPDDQVVLNFDLLAPDGFGEIIGGSIREDNHDRLLSRIRRQGLNPENYRWYLDLRKYGSVPHGGFGLGLERTLAWLTGERHIRQCIAFPRMMERVYM